jgi:hypothetical protein
MTRFPSRLKRLGLGIGVALTTVMLHGCAALPLAALGGSVMASGAGAIVKSGTEYTFSGTAHRTFTVPINAVRAAVLEAFNRADVQVEAETTDRDRIVGKLRRRTVKVELTAFSSSLTGMELSVTRTVFKDRATSSELLEQIEQVLAENPTFARRLQRVPTPDAAASPALYWLATR